MSKRILVVEDQEDNRQIVRDLLTANDYEMTEAENGEEALAAVAKDRPDLILMDIQLPVMDGYEFRAVQCRDDDLADIPVIVCTAGGEAGRRADELQAAGYLDKPVDVSALLDAIQRAL